MDLEARRAALDLPEVIVADRPHAAEHAIETQLPFLLRTLGTEVPVLPMLVGVANPEAVAGLLCAADRTRRGGRRLDRPQPLPGRARAHRRDRRTAAAVLARDPEALGPADACGYRPLAARTIRSSCGALPRQLPPATSSPRVRDEVVISLAMIVFAMSGRRHGNLAAQAVVAQPIPELQTRQTRETPHGPVGARNCAHGR